VKISVCTTNYNCAHALDRHLKSVFEQLEPFDFEYIVVDNRSRDMSWKILHEWATTHPNMTLLSKRCTMGEGREIAFHHSSANHIMILDTDVVYSNLLRRLTTTYFERFADLSVQSIYCGIFPRQQWIRAGGRRSLNTNEDVDLWMRVLKLGRMRWYPVPVGENLKEASAWGKADYMSGRYSKNERVLRLIRREWDLFKTRKVQRTDIQALMTANMIDLALASSLNLWPQHRIPQSFVEHAVEFVHDLKKTLATESQRD